MSTIFVTGESNELAVDAALPVLAMAGEERFAFREDNELQSSAAVNPHSEAADHGRPAESELCLKSSPFPPALEGSSNSALKDTSNYEHDCGRPPSATAPEPEENSKLAIINVSMVDAVTDNIVKVSIQHAVNRNKEHLQKEGGTSVENVKCSYSQNLEGPDLMLGDEKGDVAADKICSVDKLFCSNAGVEGGDDTNSQQKVSEMQFQSCKDDELVCLIKDCSRPDSNNDANGDDDDNLKDGDDGVMDEEVEQESEDSDSSSSTSTLSFSSSSADDEAGPCRLPIDVNDFKDLEMEAESECEEGELKESPSQRKKTSSKKKAVAESSEDEGGLKEPVRSRNEMKDLPPVPKVSVTLQPYHRMVPVGLVSSVVGVSLIVEGIEDQQPLCEGSILWLTEQRLPLGIVDELFGPVKKPFYVVRYNDAAELPEGAIEGAQVSYVRDFVDFVLNKPDLYAKGYDNSRDNDEELSDSEVEFSDDEKEAEYKCLKSKTKRGNLELRTSDIDERQHQERRTQGKRSNRNQRSRGDNARSRRGQGESFTSREPQRPQVNESQSFMINEQQNHLQSTSQQGTMINQSQNLMQSQAQANQPHSFMQPVQPQPQPWQMNQPLVSPHMASLQLPGVQHSQMPVYNAAVVVGQVPKVAVSGYGIPTANNVPLQSGMSSGQGVLSMHQPPIFQQNPLPKQFASFGAHQLSAQVSPNMGVQLGNQMQAAHADGYPMGAHQLSAQVSPNMGMQLGNQMQAAHADGYPMGAHQLSAQVSPNMGMQLGNQMHADGYPMGVQATAFSAPVLGIPAGPVQLVHNQHYSGFTPGCASAYENQGPLSTYGVPDNSRPMQSMQPSPGTSAGSWQQQHSQGSPWQQPYQPRPHQGNAPYRNPRF